MMSAFMKQHRLSSSSRASYEAATDVLYGMLSHVLPPKSLLQLLHQGEGKNRGYSALQADREHVPGLPLNGTAWRAP